ncbi:MAG: Rab family GTPase [Candidatus Hermodarchaeota archaeon]
MFENYKPKYVFKISLIADSGVGKKTLAKKFTSRFDSNTFLAYGIKFATLDLMVFGNFIRNSLWIYSNEEQYRKLFPYYINGSNGIILMYEITKIETINFLSEILRLIKTHIKWDVPILLVGNKLDRKEDRKIMMDYLENFKKIHDISTSIEISLETGENVEKMFMDISRMMIKHFNLT